MQTYVIHLHCIAFYRVCLLPFFPNQSSIAMCVTAVHLDQGISLAMLYWQTNVAWHKSGVSLSGCLGNRIASCFLPHHSDRGAQRWYPTANLTVSMVPCSLFGWNHAVKTPLQVERRRQWNGKGSSEHIWKKAHKMNGRIFCMEYFIPCNGNFSCRK